jgi:hypothetical protein
MSDGRCRFNCRTQRESFEAGWRAALDAATAKPPYAVTEDELRESYREWKRQQTQTDARR